MRTRKTTPASSLAECLEVHVPTGWDTLSDKELRFVHALLGTGVPSDRLMLYAFLRFTGLHPLPYFRRESVLFVRKGLRVFPVTRADLFCAASRLGFLANPPSMPVRLTRWKGWRAVRADFSDMPFGHYLQAENYFQAYLQTRDSRCIAELAALLYPGFRGTPCAVLTSNLLTWYCGLKHFQSVEYPFLFRPCSQDTPSRFPDMKAVTVAEIRALHGGDITKTEAVLSADTPCALSELDAKAREAAELDRLRTR